MGVALEIVESPLQYAAHPRPLEPPEDTLHSFCAPGNCGDGMTALTGLIQASNGALYGTAYYGGAPDCGSGCGTVFTLSATME